MASISFTMLQQHVLNKLQTCLPQRLTYHSLSHTLDVLEQANIIAQAEGVTCPEELLLLRAAVLYHDAGFISTYQNHEACGCKIARQELPAFGFGQEQIAAICGLIEATKIPQSPQSHLQQIICDADLDYLGRPDFPKIALHLYHELLAMQLLTNEQEWDALQVSFLEKHQYFTAYSRQHREQRKQAHLAQLKEKLVQVP